MATDIVLRVPARTGSIHLLRTVATSAGAGSDLSVDDIDDVRLAVTEAASHLLSTHDSASTLCLRLSAVEQGIGVRLTVDRIADEQDGERARTRDAIERSLAWQILLALSEDLRTVDDEDEVGLTFTKPGRRSVAR